MERRLVPDIYCPSNHPRPLSLAEIIAGTTAEKVYSESGLREREFDCFRKKGTTNDAEMPLISNAIPVGEDRSTAIQVQDHESVKGERTSGYEDFGDLDDEFVDSDMEGSILNRPRPKKTQRAPVIPQRSEKRASRILESVVFELKSLDGSISAKEAEQTTEVSDPHELYLSSEEDASLLDEYSDSESLVDFSPTNEAEAQTRSAPSSRGSSRRSQEDTARLVSFMSVGKPQLVEIVLNPSPQKRQSLTSDTEAEESTLPRARKPSPLKLYPAALRRLSISSTMSIPTTSYVSTSYIPGTLPNESSPSLTTLPPRKSSRLASNFSSLVTSTKHAFLNSDPFPAAEVSEMVTSGEQESSLIPPTPKTPISMAAAAWKQGMARTLSKARKPSMPKLSLAYTEGVVPPKKGSGISVNADMEDDADQLDELDLYKQRQRAATTPQSSHDGPLRYEDIMRNVKRGPPPPQYSPTKERKLTIGVRGLSRRKSIRGKDRYIG